MFELPKYLPGSFTYEWITDAIALNFGIIGYKCRVVLAASDKIYKSSQKFLV